MLSPSSSSPSARRQNFLFSFFHHPHPLPQFPSAPTSLVSQPPPQTHQTRSLQHATEKLRCSSRPPLAFTAARHVQPACQARRCPPCGHLSAHIQWPSARLACLRLSCRPQGAPGRRWCTTLEQPSDHGLQPCAGSSRRPQRSQGPPPPRVAAMSECRAEFQTDTGKRRLPVRPCQPVCLVPSHRLARPWR